MSEKSTSWSEIASGVFATLTLISTALSTPPWSTLFAVLFGAIVTYMVQNRLQRESEKRKVNVDYVEKYYGPLLVEIQKIQDEVLTDVSGYYETRKLDTFKINPQFNTMGKKLRKDFLSFLDEIEKLTKKIRYYNGKVIDLICEKGNRFLISQPGTTINFIKDYSNPPILLRYSYGPDRVNIYLNDSILQDRNPIHIIEEKVANFQEPGLQVEFNLETRNDEGILRSGRDSKSYFERSMILDNIISEVKEELNRDESYRDFKVDLNNLIKNGDSLSTRLVGYIGKYVSIVDI